MIIKILGSGCTRGTPKAGCGCEGCTDAKKEGYQRLRFGVLLRHEHNGTTRNILIDASPDIRQQLIALEMGIKDIDAVLVTHIHYDHINGLGEFHSSGINRPIPVYSTKETKDFIADRFHYLSSNLLLKEIGYFKEFGLLGLKVVPIKLKHFSPDIIAGYVIKKGDKKIVIATDACRDICKESLQLMKKCDLLVTDGWAPDIAVAKAVIKEIYPNRDVEKTYDESALRHMLIPHAAELAKKIGAKKTVLMHITHLSAPHKQLVQNHQTSSLLIGFDGMEIEV